MNPYTQGEKDSPVGRFILPGPNYPIAPFPKHQTIRSYDEYSKKSVTESNGYWLEGEKVYPASLVKHLRSCLKTAIESEDCYKQETAALIEDVAKLKSELSKQHQGEPVAEILVEFFEQGPMAGIKWFTPSAFEHGATKLYTRPAQGAPVGWQFYQDGKWWSGDAHIKDHRKNTEDAGYPVRDVFAHADHGEVERLRTSVDHYCKLSNEVIEERDALRAQLAEAHALLSEALCHAQRLEPMSVSCFNRIDAVLSASAEPSAPTAQQSQALKDEKRIGDDI